MSIRGTFGPLAILGVALIPGSIAAQAVTGVIAIPTDDRPVARHENEIVAAYDSLADSTRLAVVTHKGKYFLWIQKPRLTWTVAHAGRTPADTSPAMVVLEFRTQAPQVAGDSRLVLEPASGDRIEVLSARSYGEQGPMTSNHFLRFVIPASDLAGALSGPSFRLSVGGIRVDFKPTQIYALRNLLHQAGALPLLVPTAEKGE